MGNVSFAGRVGIVTGAGGGLGPAEDDMSANERSAQ